MVLDASVFSVEEKFYERAPYGCASSRPREGAHDDCNSFREGD